MGDQQPMEDSQPPINTSDDGISSINQINHLPNPSDSNGDGESGHNLSAEKVKGALEITASTGKFWLEWEELKNMLYFQLKQVLLEYPEAKIGDGQQNSALGESYSQLVKRLEEALFSFIEGPPFTLQRLSEILLDARTIYPNLSKLALALEKNLLVTSTLTKSTDPYPPKNVQPEEQAKDVQSQPESEHHEPEPEHHQPEPEHKQPEAEHHQAEPEHQIPEPKKSDLVPTSVENGEEPGDKDEVMTEADAEADAAMTMDMETTKEIVPPSNTNPEPATGS